MDGFVGPDFDHMSEAQLRIISCLNTIKSDLKSLSPDEMIVILKMMEDMEENFEMFDEDIDEKDHDDYKNIDDEEVNDTDEEDDFGGKNSNSNEEDFDHDDEENTDDWSDELDQEGDEHRDNDEWESEDNTQVSIPALESIEEPESGAQMYNCYSPYW